jgi:hypothetical protein
VAGIEAVATACASANANDDALVMLIISAISQTTRFKSGSHFDRLCDVMML